MRRTPPKGYVLLEAIGALVVLSVGIVGIHQAMQEAVTTRAQARDYTQARFLLDELVAGIVLKPTLMEGQFQGEYEGDLSRFRWEYSVARVDLPGTEQTVVRPPGATRPITIDPPVKYMGRIEASVTWTLRNRTYEVKTQTLCQPEKLPAPSDETTQGNQNPRRDNAKPTRRR